MDSILSSLFILVLLSLVGAFLSLAHLGDREELVKWLAVVAIALVDLGAIAAGAGIALVGVFGERQFGQLTSEDLPSGLAAGDPGVQAMDPEVLARLMTPLGVVFLVLGLIGLTLLITPVRRRLALVIPIDPQRVVHTAALHLVLLLVAVSAVTAVSVNLALGNEALMDELAQASEEGGLLQLWAQAGGFVIAAFLGVGLFIRRDWRETLERLGITSAFSARWWLAATLFGLGSGVAIDNLWTRLQPENVDQVKKLTDALFGPYLEAGLLGALTIGLSAGIGEEIAFRGAAQPRLGLVLTSLVFAILHVQYTISPALIQMLIMGLLLGLARRQANTTTAIAAHASYNFLLVVLALYFPELGP